MAEPEEQSPEWTPHPLVQELFKAIKDENAEKVRSTLEKHPDLVDKKGIPQDRIGRITPLMEACFAGVYISMYIISLILLHNTYRRFFKLL